MPSAATKSDTRSIADELNRRLLARDQVVIPRTCCADDFTLSIQAGRTHYCTPRDDLGPWRTVEVGYPDAAILALLPFAEDAGRPTDTVYGYVPIDIVSQVIADHGGLAQPSVSPAPMVPLPVQQQQADAGKLGDPKSKNRFHHPNSVPRGGFIVHRRGRNRGDLIGRVRPTEHPTIEAAQAEAQRLATLLNREFAVFQEVAAALPVAALVNEAV